MTSESGKFAECTAGKHAGVGNTAGEFGGLCQSEERCFQIRAFPTMNTDISSRSAPLVFVCISSLLYSVYSAKVNSRLDKQGEKTEDQEGSSLQCTVCFQGSMHEATV